jgi:peptidoglycan/LPS O-acetylase OafA/YrhL
MQQREGLAGRVAGHDNNFDFIRWVAATWGRPEHFAAAYAATLLCAVVSWRFVEAPALSLKKRFRQWERNSGSVRAAQEL